jgi:hypothetical protein
LGQHWLTDLGLIKKRPVEIHLKGSAVATTWHPMRNLGDRIFRCSLAVGWLTCQPHFASRNAKVLIQVYESVLADSSVDCYSKIKQLPLELFDVPPHLRICST